MSDKTERELETLIKNTINEIERIEKEEPHRFHKNETMTISKKNGDDVIIENLTWIDIENGEKYFDPRTDSAERYINALHL